MADIDKKLAQIRPRISEVSPMAAYGIRGFSIFNILLGISLFTLQSTFTGQVALIGYIFNYQFWGIVFIASGLWMLYTYIKNSWRGMRVALLVMVFSKMLWLFALMFRLLGGSNSNLTVLLLWGLITYFQLGFYLHFLPKANTEGMRE